MKRCPCEPCDNCMWFRKFQVTNNETGQVDVQDMCGIEVILTELVKLISSVDGTQTASNEARNAIWGMAAGMAAHGISAPLRALQTNTGDRIIASLKNDTEEIEGEVVDQIEE